MNSWHPFQRRTIPLNLLETIQMQIQIQMKSSTLSSQRRLSPAGNLCVLGPLSRDRWWVTLPKICLGRVQNMMVVIMINAISVMILRAQFIQYTNTYMTQSQMLQSLRCNGGPMDGASILCWQIAPNFLQHLRPCLMSSVLCREPAGDHVSHHGWDFFGPSTEKSKYRSKGQKKEEFK